MRDRARAQDYDIVIGTFGSIYKGKASTALLDICRHLNSRGVRALMVFVGSHTRSLDDYENEFRAATKQKGIEDHVIVTGYVEEEGEIFALFEQIGVFLFLFPEGMTARRSSVFAALQSDRPVVVSAPSSSGHIGRARRCDEIELRIEIEARTECRRRERLAAADIVVHCEYGVVERREQGIHLLGIDAEIVGPTQPEFEQNERPRADHDLSGALEDMIFRALDVDLDEIDPLIAEPAVERVDANLDLAQPVLAHSSGTIAQPAQSQVALVDVERGGPAR